MNYNEISASIWATSDDVLRNDFKKGEYGRIILPFVVLRRLDSIIAPQKEEIIQFYNDNKNKLGNNTSIIKTKFQVPFIIAVIENSETVIRHESFAYRMALSKQTDSLYPVIDFQTEAPKDGRIILSLTPEIIELKK